MKWTLVLLASLLFVATVVRAEEEEPTSIEEVKDSLPLEEEDDETELAEKADVEGALRELADDEELPDSNKSLWGRRRRRRTTRRRRWWNRRRRRRRTSRRRRFWGKKSTEQQN